MLNGLQDSISVPVLNYMKARLEQQYPLEDRPLNEMEVWRTSHDLFLTGRMQVYGRDDIIDTVNKFARFEPLDLTKLQPMLGTSTEGKPLILVGDPGIGKSSLVSRCVRDALDATKDDPSTHVFYHFVGSGPDSTGIVNMFDRLYAELLPEGDEDMQKPTEAEALLQSLYSLLSHVTTKRSARVIIFIDALNQFSSNQSADQLRWLPKLPEGVRMVVSTLEGSCLNNLRQRASIGYQIEGSVQDAEVDLEELERKEKEAMAKARADAAERRAAGLDQWNYLEDFETAYPSLELRVGPLGLRSAAEIITKSLSVYNKRLDENQLVALLTKKDAANPLYLSLASEELRYYSVFERVAAVIITFPDTLADMVDYVINRLMNDNIPMTTDADTGPDRNAADYVRPTLCFLELAEQGLYEDEIRSLLRDDRVTLELSELQRVLQGDELLPAQSYDPISMLDWATISHPLGGFFRPSGESGKLDFYHRMMSKAVRRIFCKGADWQVWTLLLAAYFNQTTRLDRKRDELPYHLGKVHKGKLARELCDWDMFKRYYTSSGSPKLIEFWNSIGPTGLKQAAQYYTATLGTWVSEMNETTEAGEIMERYEKIGKFVLQAGCNEEAITILKAAAAFEQKRAGLNSLRRASLLQTLGEAALQYQREIHKFVSPKLGQAYNKIRGILEEALRIQKAHPDCPPYQLAMAYLMCAEVSLGEFSCVRDQIELMQSAQTYLQEATTLLRTHGDPEKRMAHVLMETALYHDNMRELNVALGLLHEAEDVCLRDLGECHLYCRILYNHFMILEETGQYKKAFYKQKKGWDVSCKILGPTHSMSLSAKNVLSEPRYVAMARQLGFSIAD
eukprot:GFYU01006732.1.p1 GENE.GFYU01006732.1~~GFYU01006732.1.p1  ORF type:complete len:888 (-),score=233.82 GFYU01006732.1:166-2712(-)